MKKDSLVCVTSAILSLTPPFATPVRAQETPASHATKTFSSSSKASIRKFIAEAHTHASFLQPSKDPLPEVLDAPVNASLNYEIVGSLANDSKSSNTSTLKIRLPNGLEAYLISDPLAADSSAGLAVKAGSWNNPVEFPGMAHFVEHLIFLGNKAFPDESEYFKFLNDRDGKYNAYTFQDKTVFGFTIGDENLEEALERFSHLFIDPLFTPSCIEREMHAVSHEFDDSEEDDDVRLWRILKETGNSQHPNAVFSCGNLESLQAITQSDIQKWFSSYYVASNMHVVMRSPLSVEKQAELIVKYFSNIQNSPIDECPSISSPITSEKQKGHFIYIEPSYKNRNLALTWEVPKEFAEQHRKRALELVQQALDYEGPTSLRHLLEEEQLIKNLFIDQVRMEKDHALLLINIDLTKKGVKEVDTVIYRCFQALNRLKQEGIPSYLFDQLSRMEQISAEITPSLAPFDYIMRTAGEMIDEYLETFPERRIAPIFDTEFVSEFVNGLTPESCIFFFIIDPSEVGVKTNAIEKWMHSPYVTRKITEEKLQEWAAASLHPSILIKPSELPLEDDIFDGVDMETDSLVIIDDEMARIHLKINEDASSDTVYLSFHLDSPLYNNSLKNTILGLFFLSAFEEELSKVFPKEREEQLSGKIDNEDAQIYLSLKVKEASAHHTLEEFFTLLRNVTLDETTFEEYKLMFLDYYPGHPSPLEYAELIAENQFFPFLYLPEDFVEMVSSLTYEDFLLFSQNLMKQVRIEGSIYGNVSEKTAISYWTTIESVLQASSYERENNERAHFSLSSLSEPVLIEKQTHRKGNALLLLLDAGPVTQERLAAQKVLTSFFNHEFFKELRTQQQTGYLVAAWGENHGDNLLQVFAIQSSTHHPRDLLQRTEQFLEDFSTHIEQKISPENIDVIRDALIAALQKKKSNYEETEDTSGIDSSIESLQSLSYADVLSMAEEYFSSQNNKRLTVLVTGTNSISE